MYLERIQSDVLADINLTANQKRILSFIREQGDKPLAGNYIAAGLGLSRSVVTAAINKLLDYRYIEKTYRCKQGQHYNFTFRGSAPKKFFLILNNYNSGYCSSKMLALAYLKYRQGENNRSWAYQKTMALDLGFKNRSQVSRLTHALDEAGDIKLHQANGGKKNGNKYTVLSTENTKTSFVALCDTRNENGAQNRTEGYNTSVDINSYNVGAGKVASSQKDIFCENPEKRLAPHGKIDKNVIIGQKFSCLVRRGVKIKVAESLAQDKRLSLLSIQNAIANGIFKEKTSDGCFRLLPGYLVASLNGAIEKGKQIELTRAAKAEKKKFDNASSFAKAATRPQKRKTGIVNPLFLQTQNRPTGGGDFTAHKAAIIAEFENHLQLEGIA